MGMGTAKEDGVKHPLNLDIIYVETLAGHESEVFESPDWLSRITQSVPPL
jgi:hypothetical protein